jgi:hypothetical protein
MLKKPNNNAFYNLEALALMKLSVLLSHNFKTTKRKCGYVKGAKY